MKVANKRSAQVTILFFLSVMLTGCSNILEDAASIEKNANEVALTLNLKTEVAEGDVYRAKSADAQVTIEYDTALNKKYITLTQGAGAIAVHSSQ